jgi:hypothetical protein
MDFPDYDNLVYIEFSGPILTHSFTISPLVPVGTRNVSRTEFKR